MNIPHIINAVEALACNPVVSIAATQNILEREDRKKRDKDPGATPEKN